MSNNKFIDQFTDTVFGRKRDGKQCVICGSEKVSPEDFSTDLSRKEFHISFMCQACQDHAFREDDEEDE